MGQNKTRNLLLVIPLFVMLLIGFIYIFIISNGNPKLFTKNTNKVSYFAESKVSGYSVKINNREIIDQLVLKYDLLNKPFISFGHNKEGGEQAVAPRSFMFELVVEELGHYVSGKSNADGKIEPDIALDTRMENDTVIISVYMHPGNVLNNNDSSTLSRIFSYNALLGLLSGSELEEVSGLTKKYEIIEEVLGKLDEDGNYPFLVK